MPKILITTSSFDLNLPEVTALKKSGYEIVMNPHGRRIDEKEISALLVPDVEGIIAGLEPLTKTVLEGAKGLRVISRCGAGLDNVDLEAAKNLNITVMNTPAAPARAVAELTIGLMLDALRGISAQDRVVRQAEWPRLMGGLLGTRIVGVIGFGHIGKLVAQFASAFGAKILAYDPHVKDHKDVQICDLDTLLKQADIISLHIPYTKSNHHIIGKNEIAKMKKGAILINTARGGLIDEDAVVQSLQSKQLSAAAFDVFEQEPYKGPLVKLENAILTAHVGSYAAETRAEQEAEAAQNLLIFLKRNVEGKRNHG